MNNTIKNVAENLLGRPLTKSDGIENHLIDKAEVRLGQKLPEALKQFYTLVGNLEMFTSSFNSFMPLDELEYKDNMLAFLEENQGVCSWGVNPDDTENPVVCMYASINDAVPTWHPEKIRLNDFLKVTMYLQCTEGGYEYCCAVYEDDFENRKEYEQFLAETIVGSEKVVDHNGFTVYQKENILIWYFSDSNGRMEDILYASSLTEEGMEEMEALGFSEL